MAPRSSDLKYLSTSAAAAARIRRMDYVPNGAALWTEKEIAVCRALYPDVAALKKKLRRRSENAIRQRCHFLKLSPPKKHWTAAEMTRLRRLFPATPWKTLLDAFPGRTRNSIQLQARLAGIRRERRPYKATGHELTDRVRQRCMDLGSWMPDLDDWARTGNHFKRNALRNQKEKHDAVARAVKALGGRLKVEWSNEQT